MADAVLGAGACRCRNSRPASLPARGAHGKACESVPVDVDEPQLGAPPAGRRGSTVCRAARCAPDSLGLLGAPLLGKTPELVTSGQITYDLRRLRLHGLIQRVPGTIPFQVTGTGLSCARYLTRLHDRLLRTGLAQLTDPDPPAPAALRAADRAYQATVHELTGQAGLAA